MGEKIKKKKDAEKMIEEVLEKKKNKKVSQELK
jgi:hypothetical protein